MAQLLPTAGQALLRNLGNEARGLFTIDNSPLFDPAGFLADPDTPPLSQQPAKALGRAICRAWANRDGDSNNPAADRLYGGACAPYLDSIGERPDPGTIGLPFEGGQCNAVYLVSSTRTTNLSGTGSITFRARGPIGGVRLRQVSGNNYDWEIFANNVNFAQTSCGTLAAGTSQWYRIGGVNSSDGNQTTSITNIVPCGLDNCGNPPPEYEPPKRPITVGPIIPILIDLPDIGEINVDVNILPDATINLCSEDLDVCVEINPPDAEPGGGGGGVGGDDLVPDGGLSGSPADTGDGGTAAGEAPPGQELVGVRVEVLESPIGVNTYDNVSTTVFRGIGYVRMGYPGRLALDMGGAAVISPQFFLAPVRGLTNWEVRANNGFINRVTPFYRDLPS